jgi:hypothetical protein
MSLSPVSHWKGKLRSNELLLLVVLHVQQLGRLYQSNLTESYAVWREEELD